MPVFASIAQSGNDELAFIERGGNTSIKEGDVVVRENPEKTWNDFLAKKMQKAPPEPSITRGFLSLDSFHLAKYVSIFLLSIDAILFFQ